MSTEWPTRHFGSFRHLLAKELRDVLRDRRAAFFTFVFPLAVYPLLLLISSRVQEHGSGDQSDRSVRVGLSGKCDEFCRLIGDVDSMQVVRDVPMKKILLEKEKFDVLLDFRPAEGATDRVAVRVLHDGARSMSREARGRVDRILDHYRLQLISRRFDDSGGRISAAGLLRVETTDVAASGERAGAFLVRFLPTILILLFLTGGAFAALDLVAGEKERGTLETLFVQPVSGGEVAAAKFLVVFLCSFGAAVLNLLGMAIARELQPQTGFFAELSLPQWPALVLVGLLLLPLAVLTSGVLMAISTVARTFREAQTYLVPVMLLGIVPSLLAAMPNVELNLLTAWIPVANISLAVRDTVAGDPGGLTLSVVFCSTLVYAILTLRWSARLLTREEVLLGSESEAVAPGNTGRPGTRHAVAFGGAVVLGIYYLGTLVQSPDGAFGIYWGLAMTLWIVALGPAILYPMTRGLRLRQLWALRTPHPRDLALALVAVPLVALIVTAYVGLQSTVLPFPESLESGFRELFELTPLHPVLMFLLFAVSPAICEELLWRGTFQGLLDGERRPVKTILLVGLFFGLFHLSVYRLVPTFLVGCVLAFLRWRTASILPSIAFHGCYNALLIFVVAPLSEEQYHVLDVLQHPLSLGVAAGLLLLGARRLGARR